MELKMKAICEGSKSRSDVVQESLGQYREVFITTSRRIDVLKAVCRHTLSAPCFHYRRFQLMKRSGFGQAVRRYVLGEGE
jgi:hypothetical protein